MFGQKLAIHNGKELQDGFSIQTALKCCCLPKRVQPMGSRQKRGLHSGRGTKEGPELMHREKRKAGTQSVFCQVPTLTLLPEPGAGGPPWCCTALGFMHACKLIANTCPPANLTANHAVALLEGRAEPCRIGTAPRQNTMLQTSKLLGLFDFAYTGSRS